MGKGVILKSVHIDCLRAGNSVIHIQSSLNFPRSIMAKRVKLVDDKGSFWY